MSINTNLELFRERSITYSFALGFETHHKFLHLEDSDYFCMFKLFTQITVPCTEYWGNVFCTDLSVGIVKQLSLSRRYAHPDDYESGSKSIYSKPPISVYNEE